jgi:hypothetical protein
VEFGFISLHLYRLKQFPMQQSTQTGSGPLSVRRNTQMRSIWITYPRKDDHGDVLVRLFNLHQVDMKMNLPVLNADTEGISVTLPGLLSGIFYLNVQDGDTSFFRRIAIQ